MVVELIWSEVDRDDDQVKDLPMNDEGVPVQSVPWEIGFTCCYMLGG